MSARDSAICRSDIPVATKKPESRQECRSYGITGRFDRKLHEDGLGELRRDRVEIFQINVGKLCNMTCVHCHVNAGPGRKEIMTRETIDRVVDWLAQTDIPKVDITGGAPEIIPDFRYLVDRVKALTPSRHVMDRCNLTIFYETGFEYLPEFLAHHEVEVIASLPCYSAKNVDMQRGNGAFEKSVSALRWLNELGYGTSPALPLHLIYNPVGAYLPGPQEELEADYHRELKEHFGIIFNRLYTITNMPIARFAAWLRRNGEYERYMQLLIDNFNPASVAGLMCRSTLSVGWRGEVYDCDFNQMLDMQWVKGRPLFLWDIDPGEIENRPILTGDHCFGCTAGAGSGCGGAIVKSPCPSP
jgi:radical SAM/Cys-rich protein